MKYLSFTYVNAAQKSICGSCQCEQNQPLLMDMACKTSSWILVLIFVFASSCWAGFSVIHSQSQSATPPPAEVAPANTTAPNIVAPRAAPSAPAPSVADQDDRDLKELVEIQKKAAAQIDVLNQVNPQQVINTVADGSGVAAVPAQLDFSKLPPQFQTLRPLLESRAIRGGFQRMVAMAQTAQFQQAANAVTHNPNGKWMYVGMLLVFVSYALLKKRMLAATDSLLMRLLIRLAMFVLFLIAQFSIAFAVFGEPFGVLMQGWYKVFFG